MIRVGLPIRHIEQSRNVPMFNTNIACNSAGRFEGNLVVSMRPIPSADIVKAVEVTSRYPRVHGAPVHIGSPETIGIRALDSPDYGESVELMEGDVPIFWACGVTPQAAVMQSKPSFCITHSPGCMLVLDLKNEELSL